MDVENNNLEGSVKRLVFKPYRIQIKDLKIHFIPYSKHTPSRLWKPMVYYIVEK
jgi:hypothetical protein